MAGLYTAFGQNTDLTMKILTEEISQTIPLSRTMPEKISELRNWAKGRFVLAN